MKHARKMLLVHEEFVKAMEMRNQVQTTSQVNSLTQLCEQMDNVLADERLPAEIKTQLYDQMLHRYLDLQSRKENAVPTVQIQPPEGTFDF